MPFSRGCPQAGSPELQADSLPSEPAVQGFPRNWATAHFLAFYGPRQNWHGIKGVISSITMKV